MTDEKAKPAATKPKLNNKPAAKPAFLNEDAKKTGRKEHSHGYSTRMNKK